MNIQKDRVYVIAEIGGNFTNYKQAIKLVDCAAECGVNAVKIQTYKAETLTSSKAIFDMENTGVISQFGYFEKFKVTEELHHQVFNYAKSKGLDVFSTPSHITDIDMLERVGCDIYKIGSDDAVNIPYLKSVANIGKPIILATGMCTMEEVKESVSTILGEGNENLMLLHAITQYPTHPIDVNLKAMQSMMNEFPNLIIGYSDHTLGTTAAICAAAMGAGIIEKHFTYDKGADGPDHMHSANIEEMKYIVDTIREFEIMRGSGIKMPAKEEKITRYNNRKSIVMIKNVLKNEMINRSMIDIKRPGHGIAPKYFNQILGRRAVRDMEVDEVLTWDDLS